MWSHTLLALLLLGLTQGEVFRKRLGPPPPDGSYNRLARAPIWGTIEQKLDHYNPTDKRTWSMRYLSNDQFFEDGGPLVIYLGGEWTISTGSLMTGQVFDIAQEHSGYMFYTEHRYYGQSYPTEDYSTENLRYLSIDQALEDVAYFIKYQKATISGLANSKVVVVGGSYSATMATWIREKYPHLVDIAYASSAPLQAIKDFHEYYEVVHHNIGLHSQECLNVIEEAIEQTEALLETEEGRETVKELYNTCSSVQNTEPHRAFFFNTIAEIFAGLVQYANVGQIPQHCEQILGYNGSSLDQLAQYARSQVSGCMGLYDEFLADYASTQLTTNAYRQWFYQSCTEFGFFQTTTSDSQPFRDTFPLELYMKICLDLFDELATEDIVDKSVYRTNLVYGDLSPELSHVISIHGTVDPWHALGLTDDLAEDVVTIVVNGTSHCKDLSSVSDSDIEELKQAKIRAKELIAKWLSE